jgi:hypothetical protein
MLHDASIYKELRGIYDRQQIPRRIAFLKSLMENYIRLSGSAGLAAVNDNLISAAVIDYFADIMRVKDFHNIEYTNREKIFAYTSYWLYRRKPIQLLGLQPDEVRAHINEAFISAFISDGILELSGGSYISGNIREHLFYHLKYRLVDAKNLEMLISACVSMSRMK